MANVEPRGEEDHQLYLVTWWIWHEAWEVELGESYIGSKQGGKIVTGCLRGPFN